MNTFLSSLIDKIMSWFGFEKELMFCANFKCRKNIRLFMKQCIYCNRIFCPECFKNHKC